MDYCHWREPDCDSANLIVKKQMRINFGKRKTKCLTDLYCPLKFIVTLHQSCLRPGLAVWVSSKEARAGGWTVNWYGHGARL